MSVLKRTPSTALPAIQFAAVVLQLFLKFSLVKSLNSSLNSFTGLISAALENLGSASPFLKREANVLPSAEAFQRTPISFCLQFHLGESLICENKSPSFEKHRLTTNSLCCELGMQHNSNDLGDKCILFQSHLFCQSLF